MSALTAGQMAAIDTFGAAFANDVMVGMIDAARAVVAADIERAVEVARRHACRASEWVIDQVYAGVQIEDAAAVALDCAVADIVAELSA